MEKIRDIMNKFQAPKVELVMIEATDSEIMFSKTENLVIAETGDEFIDYINKVIIDNTKLNTNLVFETDRSKVEATVANAVNQFHINLWMAVNKKKEFRRTSLSKLLRRAKNSPEFKENSLELYLDAIKHGIKKDNLKYEVIRPIHKFIASKYQAMVELECPK